MKIYRSGENLIVDKLAPFQPVYINITDVVILEWGEGSIGIHSNESQRTYRDDWSLITDENGVLYGSDFQETIDAVKDLLIDVIAQTEGEENRVFNYVALNYGNLQTIATSPAEGDIAYVKEAQGTSWLPWSLGGAYYPTGLYYYDGVEWVSDKEAVAEQLQVNIEDIDDLESEVQSNDLDITALQSGLSSEVSNRINADTNLQNQINSNSFKVKVDSADVTGEFLEDKLLNGPEIRFDKTIGATKELVASVETNGLDNSKFKQVATQTFKGRNSAGFGNVEDLTPAEVKVMLGIPTNIVETASGQIVDNTDPANPVFNENTYIEESTIIAGSTSGAWVVRSLGPAYANNDVEMKVYKSANNTISQFGVREVGSSVPKFFPIRRGTIHMEVRANSNGEIEIQSNNTSIIFEVTGRKQVL